MTQTGAPVSPATAPLGAYAQRTPAKQARKPLVAPARPASGQAAARFAELLEAAKRDANRDLMGPRREPEDRSPDVLAAAGTPDVQAKNPENRPLEGETGPADPGTAKAAAARQTPDSEAAAAAVAGQPAEDQQETTEPARLSGSGPGGQAGRPSGGGQDPGPTIGSITQAEATDGTARTGSQPQGPGTGLIPVGLDDLQVVPPDQEAGAQADAGDDGAPPGDGELPGAVDVAEQADAGEAAPPEVESAAPVERPPDAGAVASKPPIDLAKTVNLEKPGDLAPLRSAMIEHIEGASRGGTSSIRLVLQPEHLGEVQVRVTLVEGSVNAFVRVENPAVREAVMHQLEGLRMALTDHGIKIDRLEVSVSTDSDQRQDDAFADMGQGREPGRHADDAAGWALPDTYQAAGAQTAELAGDTQDEPGAGGDRAAILDVRA